MTKTEFKQLLNGVGYKALDIDAGHFECKATKEVLVYGNLSSDDFEVHNLLIVLIHAYITLNNLSSY